MRSWRRDFDEVSAGIEIAEEIRARCAGGLVRADLDVIRGVAQRVWSRAEEPHHRARHAGLAVVAQAVVVRIAPDRVTHADTHFIERKTIEGDRAAVRAAGDDQAGLIELGRRGRGRNGEAEGELAPVRQRAVAGGLVPAVVVCGAEFRHRRAGPALLRGDVVLVVRPAHAEHAGTCLQREREGGVRAPRRIGPQAELIGSTWKQHAAPIAAGDGAQVHARVRAFQQKITGSVQCLRTVDPRYFCLRTNGEHLHARDGCVERADAIHPAHPAECVDVRPERSASTVVGMHGNRRAICVRRTGLLKAGVVEQVGRCRLGMTHPNLQKQHTKQQPSGPHAQV